jgi:hypothetical protein
MIRYTGWRWCCTGTASLVTVRLSNVHIFCIRECICRAANVRSTAQHDAVMSVGSCYSSIRTLKQSLHQLYGFNLDKPRSGWWRQGVCNLHSMPPSLGCCSRACRVL